jgi:hypothetical protein
VIEEWLGYDATVEQEYEYRDAEKRGADTQTFDPAECVGVWSL